MKLDARDVSVTAREKTLVSAASVSVCSGEFVGLVGPNGAGKSTLLSAMLGARQREAGTITLDGRDFLAMAPRERATQVAFLPQDRRVEWRLSAYDILMLGRYPHQHGFGGPTEFDRAAVGRAIEAVDAQDLLDRPVGVLSGGERTRILLARALAVEAPILLADEPISALDPFHQLHVMEILHALARRGTGVLAVIHDLALAARFMDRLILMDRGRIVAEGAPGDVLAPPLLASVYGVEALRGVHQEQNWLLPWARLGA